MEGWRAAPPLPVAWWAHVQVEAQVQAQVGVAEGSGGRSGFGASSCKPPLTTSSTRSCKGRSSSRWPACSTAEVGNSSIIVLCTLQGTVVVGIEIGDGVGNDQLCALHPIGTVKAVAGS